MDEKHLHIKFAGLADDSGSGYCGVCSTMEVLKPFVNLQDTRGKPDVQNGSAKTQRNKNRKHRAHQIALHMNVTQAKQTPPPSFSFDILSTPGDLVPTQRTYRGYQVTNHCLPISPLLNLFTRGSMRHV